MTDIGRPGGSLADFKGTPRGADASVSGVLVEDMSMKTLGLGLRIVFLIVSIAVLSVALPAFLVSDIPDTGRSPAWILTLMLMIWSGARLSLLWIAGTQRLFDFFFWLFCYIFMGIAPTVQIRADAISTTTPGIDSAYDMPTAAIVIGGVACYEIARLARLIQEHARPAVRHLEVRSVSLVRTIVLTGIGLVLSAYFVSRVGTVGAFGSRDGAFAARNAAWPDPSMRALFYAAAVYPLLVAIGALAQLARSSRSKAARRGAAATAIVAAAVLLTIVNPVASARYTFGTVAFALAIYAGAAATRRRARILMLSAIFGFLFLFPLADAFRTDTSRVDRVSFFGEYLANPDYDAFWQIANALSYWVDGLVRPLNQLLGCILFWMPRAIWPDKPTDTGVLLAQYRGYSFDNLSAPLWAEALVNGGVVAVVIAFLVLGYALRAIDSRILTAFGPGGIWAIVGAIFPVFMTILMRGSLLQATGATTVTILSIFFVIGRRARPTVQCEPEKTSSGISAGSVP